MSCRAVAIQTTKMTDPSKADAHPQSSSTGLGDDAVDAMSVSVEEGAHPASYPRGLKFAVPMLATYLIFTVIGLVSAVDILAPSRCTRI